MMSIPTRFLFSGNWRFVLSAKAIFWSLSFLFCFFFWWGQLASRGSRCSAPPCASSRTGRQRHSGGLPSKSHQGPLWPPDHQTGTRPLHHPLAHAAADYICFPLRWRSKTAAERCSPTSGWLWEGTRWGTAADGGVGMWINRLASRLTDGIYGRSRRQRINFFEVGTRLSQIHSS